ncbi:MAG: hypothetical protein QE271_09395 [Bacteriovoracaceae bacterium]|nr:hypothetical protein [Bacteriovoracaceae bacterium]
MKHQLSADWSLEYFWNTPYLEVESLQQKIIEKLRIDPKQKYLLVGSHPHCFTMGRGLQKKDGEILENLTEFDELKTQQQFPDWPFYKSSRAGGMTFHHPNQIIIYPLVNLNFVKISLPKIMFLLLESCKISVQDHLQDYVFDGNLLEVKKEPLGLWLSQGASKRKIASIGMALDHFVTCHGLALNLAFDQKVKDMLNQNYPCGLPGDTYAPLFGEGNENKRDTIAQKLVIHFTQVLSKLEHL